MAIVFGLVNPTFLAESDKKSPKCTYGEVADLELFPKLDQFFLVASLIGCRTNRVDTVLENSKKTLISDTVVVSSKKILISVEHQ